MFDDINQRRNAKTKNAKDHDDLGGTVMLVFITVKPNRILASVSYFWTGYSCGIQEAITYHSAWK